MDVGSTQKPLTLDAPGSKRLVSVEKAANVAELASRKQQSSASDPSIGRDQVEEAVATLQEFVQSVRRNLNFSVDDGTGQVVVRVTDTTSGDVIRQIPSEEALQLAENLTEVRSLLFKAEA